MCLAKATASRCSGAVVVVGENEGEELPIDNVVEQCVEVGVKRYGIEATATVFVCIWIVGPIARNWVGECAGTTTRTFGRWCGITEDDFIMVYDWRFVSVSCNK